MSDSRPTVSATEDAAYRPPYLAAALATLGVFILYSITLSPTTWFWDTSEYIATAHILGIPHPPGNPLFVLLGRTWDLLLTPFGLPVAVRINLFSATMGALAHGCWFLLADRVLAFYSTDRVFRLIGASAAVLISATAYTVWNQSNVNEKVYTVSLFTIALLSFLAFRWRDRLGVGKDDNLILLMVFILALSVGNHLMAFLAAPAIILFILIVDARTLLNWRLYAAGLVAIVLGLSVHLFLPIRAGLDPIINEADPTCTNLTSAIQSVLTFGGTGCSELSAALAREQYDKPSMMIDPVVYALEGLKAPRSPQLFFAQVANYFQYFDWQWSRSVDGNVSWFAGPRVLITILFITLGGFGALSNWRHDRKSFAYIAVLFITLSVGLTFYLNFKYGYSSPWARGNNTEVRERDYFFIVSFSIWGLWCGIGLAALWRAISDRFFSRSADDAPADAAPRRSAGLRGIDSRRPAWAAAPIMAIALIPLFANWSWASRRGDYSARDWAYNLLMSVEPYGVLFTNGDNDTFPLWYLQEAEGIRRDVTVIVMSYLNTEWYAKQLRDLTSPCQPGSDPDEDPTRILCQRSYVAPDGVDLYPVSRPRGDTAGVDVETGPPGMRAPTQSILPITDDQIRQVATTQPYRTSALPFRAGNISTTVPEGTPLMPADVFMAYIITSAIADRPIYFAMTTAAYNSLDLFPYLIRQGVAFKLNNGPVLADPARGIVEIVGGNENTGRYFDLPRSEALLNDVFVHHPGFPEDWNRWIDPATEGIPLYYGLSYYTLATAYQFAGDSAKAQGALQKSEPFIELAEKRNTRLRELQQKRLQR